MDAAKGIKEEEERDEKSKSIALLQYNLKRNALSLANRLVNKFNPRELGYLAGDKNFVKLAEELKAEFDNGYHIFISEAKKRGTASYKNH